MDALIEQISDAAHSVYSELKAGYNEVVYEEAMAVELRERGIDYELEHTTEIFYKDIKVGSHRLDLIVDRRVAVELKAATGVAKSHIAQLGSYIRTLGLEKGLVINFPYPEKEGPQIEIVES